MCCGWSVARVMSIHAVLAIRVDRRILGCLCRTGHSIHMLHPQTERFLADGDFGIICRAVGVGQVSQQLAPCDAVRAYVTEQAGRSVHG